MSLSKFENSIVDQFLKAAALTSQTEAKRTKVFLALKTILWNVLDESVLIKTFGSGPLKTYLPDSDIDITVIFKHRFLKEQNLENSYIIGLYELQELKLALENYWGEHKIDDVTFINADVKLIKLYCDGIPIDISFNQIGGICTLGYLESIDKLVGNDHLFKKSILII